MRFAIVCLLPFTLLSCAKEDPEGNTLVECADGEDNDNDGVIDCDEPDCAGLDVCTSDDTGATDGTDGTADGTTDGTADGTTDGTTDGSDGGIPATPRIVVNEVMAANKTTIADESGLYTDWIELYNDSDELVDLTGWTVTDDLGTPDKFALASITIEPHGWLLLWASGTPELGNNHLGIRLSSDGDEIGLFDPYGTQKTALTFGAQVDDISAARVPDGCTSTDTEVCWAYTDAPTPGATNGSGA